MNLPLLGALLLVLLVSVIACKHAGAHHREICRRHEVEARLRGLQDKFFRAQKELVKAKKENQRLHGIDADRCGILGTTAHELRNPINALDSVFNLLEIELKSNKRPSEAICQSLFNMASEAMASMQIQVQKIIDARSDQISTHRALRSPIELNALLRQVIALNEIPASQKAIEIRLVDDSRPRIWADHNTCREIIDRLLRSTLEQAPIGSVISLKVMHPSMNEAAFSIETEGKGLSPLISDFFKARKPGSPQPEASLPTTALRQTLAHACDEIEAQGGSLQTDRNKRLTIRFPHVRLLTRNPFLEVNDQAPQPLLEKQSV